MPLGSLVLTPEQIKQKWEFERAGKAWPPMVDTKTLLHQQLKISATEDQNLALRQAVLESPIATNANLRTLLDQLFKRHGVEPAEELLKMAMKRDAIGNFELTTDQRIKVWAELLAYRMPKLKAQEVSGQIDHSLTVIVRKFGDGDTLIERSAKKIEVPIEVEIKKIAEENTRL